MEASLAAPRTLEGDKARRIIEAMRASVGARGAAASTFDHVAREAGVSRGLLHYHFGSKERLLVEVVRHDCEIRVAALAVNLVVATVLTLVLGDRGRADDRDETRPEDYDELEETREPAPTVGAGVA